MKNLRLLRKASNLTMKQLGEIINVSESTISMYETGKREPDQKTLIKIANYFNVSIDFLLGIEDVKQTNSGSSNKDTSIKFWDRFYSLCIKHNTRPNPVAQELGYSNAICNKWKNGSLPAITILIKISNYFNVSLDYLIGITDEKYATTSEKTIDEIEQEILSLTNNMSEDDKNAVLGYAIRISKKSKHNTITNK